MPEPKVPRITVKSGRVVTREGTHYEFKENFNWNSKSSYAKTMASFANNEGGFLVFGIKDSPKELVGINKSNFDGVDEQKITKYLNGTLSPALAYEKGTLNIDGRDIGYFHVPKSLNAPVVAIKNDGDVQEAAIYYRYVATSERIKYPELLVLLNGVREREGAVWRETLERIAKIGAADAAVLNVVNGRIDGAKGTLLIDKRMLPKLKFIKEGSFKESGRPVLKLVGTVRPATVESATSDSFRVTADTSAPEVRVSEETLQDLYTLEYRQLLQELKRRYSDFKIGPRFNALMRGFKGDPSLCRPRYLNPRDTATSIKKDFYHPQILERFDTHYTLRTS